MGGGVDLGRGEEPARGELRVRTSAQLLVVPTTEVVQLVSPTVSDDDELDVGATAAASGTTDGSAIAEASSRVRVDAEPNPPRTPLELVVLPGETMRRLLPSALISSFTSSWAPWPRPTVRITDEMPMTIPSIVSTDRSRCARIASRLVRSVSHQVMRPRPARRR